MNQTAKEAGKLSESPLTVLRCVVSLIGSNDVWWSEQLHLQFPNNTGNDELSLWLHRANTTVLVRREVA